MKYINDFSEFSINEHSKNDPIKEINTSKKLGIILLGTPGVGKCMEYKTPILVNDNLIEIGKLIEDNIPTDKVGEVSVPIKNLFVNSVNDNGEFVKNEISYLYRGYSDKLINFKTQSGIDIKVTSAHPLLVLDINGDILWKKSGDIEKTDKISRPRIIHNNNVGNLISVEMSRIIGYGLSDGDFSSKKNSKYFNLTSIDDDIVNDFKKCVEIESNGVLTINSKKMKHSLQYNTIKKGVRNLHKEKLDFINYIAEICGDYIFSKKSYNVEIPNVIFNNLELLKNFLACYFVCDGGVYNNRIEYYTTSVKMASDISYSLLKLGINSVIKDKKTKLKGKEFYSKIIRITGDDYNKFGETLNKYISCKRKLIKINPKTNANIGGFLPNNYFVKLIKDNNLIKKIKKEISYNSSENINYRRVLTKHRFNRIVEYLINENIEVDKGYVNIHNNLFFDKIINIEEVEHNDYVYDVVLDEFHNFIGGNIPTILHNSTFAKNFITNKNRNIKIFSTDDISYTFTKQHNTYRKGSSEINLKKLDMFMESGGSFIYDTTGVQHENVSNITSKARENGYDVIFIHLMAPLDTSLRQNQERERNVPDYYIKHAYERQHKNMHYFSNLNPDSYYIVYSIDGKYKFMKFEDEQILKRRNDKYIPLNIKN